MFGQVAMESEAYQKQLANLRRVEVLMALIIGSLSSLNRDVSVVNVKGCNVRLVHGDSLQ